MSTKPRLLLLASLLAALPLMGALAQQADAKDSSHPYFDDQGTLTWYHSLARAKRAAEHEGKLIFVEYGRRVCTQCKVLCARILPHPSIQKRMSRAAVGLAVECDYPDPGIKRMFKRQLRKARVLPFVAFLTPKGRWITGFAGRTTLSNFSAHLALAERRQAQLFRRAAGSRRPIAARPAPATPKRKPCPPRAKPKPVASKAPACKPAPKPDQRVAKVPTRKIAEFPPCAPATAEPPAQQRRDEGRPAGQKPPQEVRKPVVAVGSPDDGNPRDLPAPVVRPSSRARSPVVARGDPDAGCPPTTAPRPQVRPHGRVATAAPGNRAVAVAAAARGNWSKVIQHTRGSTDKDPELRRLNRRAHAWAHERLASAVRALRAGRYGDARVAVSEVRGAMRGEPEAVDADRGAEALELMQDLQHLSADSPVRRAVRKNAYEKMRGTRWAPLFSDCPSPSRALSQK